jgi:microcystin-dependent protein
MVTPYLGEIQIYAGSILPKGWAECNGQLLSIAQNQALFALLGTMYGGDGKTTFGLPDLRGRAPVMFGALSIGTKVGTEAETLSLAQLPAHAHAVSGLTLNCAASAATVRSPVNAVPAVEARGVTAPYRSTPDSAMSAAAISGFAPTLELVGAGGPHENRAPFLALRFIVATQGIFPSQGSGSLQSDRDPIVGEVAMFAGNFAPSGWAFCQGQLLVLSQNTALFSLLGTTFGGNGKTTFALPNLMDRTPTMWGTGPSGTEYGLGEAGGTDALTLINSELPPHSHAVTGGGAAPELRCVSGIGNASTPVGNVPATEAFGATATYSPTADASAMSHAVATQVAGSSVPHNNRPPSTVINFIIALQGVFPVRP